MTTFRPSGATCTHELCPLPGHRMESRVCGPVPLALPRPSSPVSRGDPLSTPWDTYETPEERPWMPREGSVFSLPDQDASDEMSHRAPWEPEATGRAASLCLPLAAAARNHGGWEWGYGCGDMGPGLGLLLRSVLPPPPGSSLPFHHKDRCLVSFLILQLFSPTLLSKLIQRARSLEHPSEDQRDRDEVTLTP